jgi:hypothetical protein
MVYGSAVRHLEDLASFVPLTSVKIAGKQCEDVRRISAEGTIQDNSVLPNPVGFEELMKRARRWLKPNYHIGDAAVLLVYDPGRIE